MRFATYEWDGSTASGVVADGRIHPLPDGLGVLDLVRAGLPAALDTGAEALRGEPGPAVNDVRLLPPLAPPTVRDFVTFEEHVEGMTGGAVAAEWYEAPAFYFTNPYALVGAHDDVAVPPGCQALDFELEVAAVVGTEGRDVDPAAGWEHLFGFTVLNDWSARDLQRREMKVLLGPAKGKDFATTLGPWLVTADELAPHRDADGFLDLGMWVSVNGVEVGRDLLSNMAWPFGDLVAYAARGTVVRPGDVLGSGTCGRGCLAEAWGRTGRSDPPPLRPGDVVAMTVQGIGTIANRVVTGAQPRRIPPARSRPRTRPDVTKEP